MERIYRTIVSFVMVCVIILTTAASAAPLYGENRGLRIAPLAIRLNLYRPSGPLARGSRGEDVVRLQERLIALGFLDAGEADGIYGKNTAVAVHLFKDANGLYDAYSHDPSECDAPMDTLEAIFRAGASHYFEPSMPLKICDYSYMNWWEISGDRLKFDIEVENVSKNRTVTAFELYAYAEDLWGEKVYGDSYYYSTTQKNVRGGTKVKSGKMVIPDRSSIDTIYVAIHKVKFADGEIVEYPLDYFYWNYE